MMQHGMDGVFVGSGIFKSDDPPTMADAIVLATHHYDDPEKVAEACSMMKAEAMPGLELDNRRPTRGSRLVVQSKPLIYRGTERRLQSG